MARHSPSAFQFCLKGTRADRKHHQRASNYFSPHSRISFHRYSSAVSPPARRSELLFAHGGAALLFLDSMKRGVDLAAIARARALRTNAAPKKPN